MSLLTITNETQAPTDKRIQVQAESGELLKQFRRTGLGVSMGVGKTRIGLQHMDWYIRTVDMYAAFLICCPTAVRKSWTEEAKDIGLEYLLEKITFTTYTSLTKKHQNYAILFLDECQNLKYTHDLWLSVFPGRIVGLTGTPPKWKKSEKGVMVQRYCPIRYTYLTDKAVADEILNDYRILIRRMPLSENKTYQVRLRDNRSWWTSERENYDMWTNKITNAEQELEEKGETDANLDQLRVMRMRAMMEYPTKVAYGKSLLERMTEKTIIFTNTTEQADKVCQYSYHSKNKHSKQNLQDFSDGIIDKMSCVQQLSAGINIRGLRQGILLHTYANEHKAAQRLGRLLRLSPGETAYAHILCYTDTVDEDWVRSSLENFNPEKIHFWEDEF